MNQKPSIRKIKKCMQDSRTLSLLQTDDAVRLKANCCSTFLSKSGLLVQGQKNNSTSSQSNAVVTFYDLKTSKVKGTRFLILCCVGWTLLNACLWFNTLGRAITENKRHVYSVICFLYKKKQYLGLSEDWGWFEVFDVSKLKEDRILINITVAFVYFFFQNLVLFMNNSIFQILTWFSHFCTFI